MSLKYVNLYNNLVKLTTNKDLYKQAKIGFDKIALHNHAGQRWLKYKSERKKFKNLQKEGYFPTLEKIKENKTVKTK